MKTIIHFTAVDEATAGILPFEIHRFLLGRGWQSRIVTSVPGKSTAEVIRLNRSPLTKRINNYLRSGWWYLSGRLMRKTTSDPAYRFNVYAAHRYYSSRRLLRMLPKRVDVIMVHFHDGLLDASTVADLATRTGAVVVWLMMDMAVFTGGCHYALKCDKYKTQCGSCPALGSTDPQDHSTAIHSAKRAAFARMNSIAIAGSSWQQSQAAHSSILHGQRIERLFFPVDETEFYPGGQAQARSELDIPSECCVIFFGASYLDEPRKGYHDFIRAMEILRSCTEKRDTRSPLTILIAGRSSESTSRLRGSSVQYLGLLDPHELARVYRASDVFVCPTLEDSGPLMINQSLMSGVPVVAYATGVAVDIVRNGETGFCVAPGDTEALAKRILDVLSMEEEEYRALSHSCRALAESSWTLNAFQHSLLHLIS